MVADEVDDNETFLSIGKSEPAAELLEKDDRRLGGAQHQHRVHGRYVEAFIEDVHGTHDLESPVGEVAEARSARSGGGTAVDSPRGLSPAEVIAPSTTHWWRAWPP